MPACTQRVFGRLSQGRDGASEKCYGCNLIGEELAVSYGNLNKYSLCVIQKAILCYHVLFLDCIENVKLAWPTNDRKSRARLVMNAVSYQPQT